MECPVDFITINENKARLTAFFVLVLTIAYLLTGLWLLIAVLLPDFLLRALNQGKYSYLGFLSDAVIKQLSIKPKPVDRAPKRFAAMLGLAFVTAILVAIILQATVIAFVLAVVMAVFAMLESFFAFCAGCYVYIIGKSLSGKF